MSVCIVILIYVLKPRQPNIMLLFNVKFTFTKQNMLCNWRRDRSLRRDMVLNEMNMVRYF